MSAPDSSDELPGGLAADAAPSAPAPARASDAAPPPTWAPPGSPLAALTREGSRADLADPLEPAPLYEGGARGSKGPALPATVAYRLIYLDRPAIQAGIFASVSAAGGSIRTLSTTRQADEAGLCEIEVEVEGLDDEILGRRLRRVDGIKEVRQTRSLGRIFGKRVIVIGGGAQIAQVTLGAVSEADRHNLRGERISVDTIALVGEDKIAAAVRAVADLPRARLLVLAGSIMGGEISRAADELRAHGIPIIALNMVGSITEHVDLVISDPVQAGTMAVMAVADTARFDLTRQRGRRY